MDLQFNFLKFVFATAGCILVFSLPIIGILALWGFDTASLRDGFNSLFITENTKDGKSYNFDIPAGEDDILPSNIKNESRAVEITPQENPASLIIINSVQIEGPVVYGQNGEELLRQGFWHYPGSAYPGEEGISIIFGHRRHHLPPAKDTFYNLDKVNVGNRVEIQLQDGTWLEYTVDKIEVINPEDLYAAVTAQSDESLVKFITCTPLGTDKQRLIVTAEKTF